MSRKETKTKGPSAEDTPSCGDVIRWAREGFDLTIRQLGRLSGISAAQISRLEAGRVDQPSIDTLVALARAMDRNPKPLLIVSGHIGLPEAREILVEMFRPDSELVDEWSYGWGKEIDEARKTLRAVEPSEARLKSLAAKVFITAETEETLWWDAWLAPLLEKSGGEDLKRLVHAWETLPPERRTKVLEYASDQTDLFRHDLRDKMQAAPSEGRGGS